MYEKANVVVLISHDTGRFISPYGVDTVNTPHFERLASESVRFANAYSTAPQCSPARAALFSGRFPHSVGVMGNVGREHGWRFPDQERHAARFFSEAGYETCLLGVLHETYLPETLGFEKIDLGFDIMETSRHMERFLTERDASRPFYCQIGCKETHRPWDRHGTLPDDELGITVPPYLENGPETRRDLAQFQGSVRSLDSGLGLLLDTLERHGLEENTILVVTTDHGIAVPRAKATLRDAGIEVFLFLRYPAGGWPAGEVRGELVSHVDLLPSLLEASGIEIPAVIQGRIMLPLLTGAPYVPNEAVFSEMTHFHMYDPMRAIRTPRYKYIRNFEFSRQSDFDIVSLKSGSWRELGYRYLDGHPLEELYDVQADPNEMHNLAGDSAVKATRDRLARDLAAWMHQTGDPLLRGPIATPFFYRELASFLEGG